MKPIVFAFSKNMLVQFTLVIVAFISTPLIYKYIGRDSLSFILIVIELSYFLQNFDLGISNALIRRISMNLYDNEAWRAIFKVGEAQLYLLSITIFVTLFAMCVILTFLLNLSVSMSVFLFLMSLSVALSIAAYAPTGLLRVLFKYNDLTFISITSSIFFLFSLAVGLYFGGGIFAIGTSFVLRAAVYFCYCYIITNRVIGKIKYTEVLVEKISILDSFKLMVFSFSYTLFHQIDSAIIGTVVDINLVPAFIANKRFFDFAKSSLDALTAVSFPKMVGYDKVSFTSKELWFFFGVPYVIYFVASICNYFFLSVWIPSISSFGITFILLSLITGVINYYSYFCKTFLSANGLFINSAIISTTEFAVKLLSIFIMYSFSFRNIYLILIVSVVPLSGGFVTALLSIKNFLLDKNMVVKKI